MNEDQLIPDSARMSLACAMRHYHDAPLSAILAIRRSDPDRHNPLREKGSAYFQDRAGYVFAFDLSLHAVGTTLDLSGPQDKSDLDLIRNQAFYQHLAHICVALTSAYEHCSPELTAEKIVVLPACVPIMATKAILSDDPSPFKTEQSQAAVVAMASSIRDFLKRLDYADIKRSQIALISEAIPRMERGVSKALLEAGLEPWKEVSL